jgi:hypothetical protein
MQLLGAPGFVRGEFVDVLHGFRGDSDDLFGRLVDPDANLRRGVSTGWKALRSSRLHRVGGRRVAGLTWCAGDLVGQRQILRSSCGRAGI